MKIFKESKEEKDILKADLDKEEVFDRDIHKFDGNDSERYLEVIEEKEEWDEEVNKELDDRKDVVDDINKQPSKKAIAIKGITEKLILPEVDDRSLQEDVLNEKIPKDLKKAYDSTSRYKGGRGVYTDLENSNYTPVSPEEAKEIYKKDPTLLDLIVDGHLVKFRDNGKPSADYRVEWVPEEHRYVKSTGTIVRDTRKMPASHLFNIASKIYQVDEKEIDNDLKAKRAQNPESRYSQVKHLLPTRDLKGRYIQRGQDDYQYYIDRYSEYVKDDKKSIKDLERMRDSASEDHKAYYDDRIAQYKDRLMRHQASLNDYIAKDKDHKAVLRYGYSGMSLREPFQKYQEYKRKVKELEFNVNDAQSKLDTTRAEGSRETRKARRDLQDLQDQMKSLKKKMARLEIILSSSEEDDADAVAEAERYANEIISQYEEAQAELNKLLRRK